MDILGKVETPQKDDQETLILHSSEARKIGEEVLELNHKENIPVRISVYQDDCNVLETLEIGTDVSLNFMNPLE